VVDHLDLKLREYSSARPYVVADEEGRDKTTLGRVLSSGNVTNPRGATALEGARERIFVPAEDMGISNRLPP
jgi:hypothetical protein